MARNIEPSMLTLEADHRHLNVEAHLLLQSCNTFSLGFAINISAYGPLRQSGAPREIARFKIRKPLCSGWQVLKSAKSAAGLVCSKIERTGS